MNNINPLEHPGTVFEMPLMNPNPKSSKTQAGPIYRVSFEVPRELWDLFMEANTKGMVLATHATVADDGQGESLFGAGEEEKALTSDSTVLEELTGGKLAQDLDRRGAWRNPKIWEALCGTDAKRKAYRKWVAMEHPCMICQSEGEDRHPHHWQEKGEGKTGGKVPDYRCVPLCFTHHTGDEGVHSFQGQALDWLMQMDVLYGVKTGPVNVAVNLMSTFNRAKCRELMGVASMRDITPEMLENLEYDLEVKI